MVKNGGPHSMPLLMVGADSEKERRQSQGIWLHEYVKRAGMPLAAPILRAPVSWNWRDPGGLLALVASVFPSANERWSSCHANPARTCLMELAGVATVFPGLLEKVIF
jgi:hypothetical protein